MSDQGSGFPPEKTVGDAGEGVTEGAWVPVIDAATELPPPPPEAALPPPGPQAAAGGQYQAPPGYPPAGQYPPSGYGAPPAPPMSPNSAATVAYLTFIPAVAFLVIEPYRRDSYVRFHAWQCILLTAVWVVGGLVFRWAGLMGYLVDGFLDIILFAFWLLAIIKATKGQRYHVPILGDLAENLANSV